MIPKLMGSSPTLGSVLIMSSLLGILSLSLCPSLPLSLTINKHLKKCLDPCGQKVVQVRFCCKKKKKVTVTVTALVMRDKDSTVMEEENLSTQGGSALGLRRCRAQEDIHDPSFSELPLESSSGRKMSWYGSSKLLLGP